MARAPLCAVCGRREGAAPAGALATRSGCKGACVHWAFGRLHNADHLSAEAFQNSADIEKVVAIVDDLTDVGLAVCRRSGAMGAIAAQRRNSWRWVAMLGAVAVLLTVSMWFIDAVMLPALSTILSLDAQWLLAGGPLPLAQLAPVFSRDVKWNRPCQLAPYVMYVMISIFVRKVFFTSSLPPLWVYLFVAELKPLVRCLILTVKLRKLSQTLMRLHPLSPLSLTGKLITAHAVLDTQAVAAEQLVVQCTNLAGEVVSMLRLAPDRTTVAQFRSLAGFGEPEGRIFRDFNMYSHSEVVRFFDEEVGQQSWDAALARVAYDNNAYTRGEYLRHYGLAIGERLWNEAASLSNAVHLVTPDGLLVGGANDDRLVADVLLSS